MRVGYQHVPDNRRERVKVHNESSHVAQVGIRQFSRYEHRDNAEVIAHLNSVSDPSKVGSIALRNTYRRTSPRWLGNRVEGTRNGPFSRRASLSFARL